MIQKNIENIKKVLDKIESNPECWNQKQWHCGTSHCFAGWAQILSGKPEDVNTVRRHARIFFGFTKHEADYYFAGRRTLDELKTALEDWYDSDGYGRDGYGRDGYNRFGYDREGYDCGGYNRKGYNRDGRDRKGYDRDGYDRDGYDRDGLDRDGLDKYNNPRP